MRFPFLLLGLMMWVGAGCQRPVGPAAALRVGHSAPAFSLPDSLGQPLRLRQLRGQYVLLDFRPETAADTLHAFWMRRLHQQFASRGLTIVHVLGPATAAPMLPGRRLYASSAAVAALQRRYHLPAAGPYCVFIGPEGRVLAAGLQGRALGQAISGYIPLD